MRIAPTRRDTVLVILVSTIALVATALVIEHAVTDAPPARLSTSIDSPAADQIVPADAASNVKTEFGARGDGTTDDTDAIQRAISSTVGLLNRDKVLYFPAGVYLVRRPLEWRAQDGTWQTWLRLAGENRDRTVLRLADSSSGFADPARPRAVISTASQSPDRPDGSGNQAFSNSITDLTVDVGAGNPGATGIDYLANNRGVLRNVIVEGRDGGAIGIAMTRRYPGPCLLQDVLVRGFGVGIDVAQSEYGVTVEHLRLADQTVVGLRNTGNVTTIRDLRSTNTEPAVENGKGPGDGSVMVLTDALLTGSDGGQPAMRSPGALSAQGVSTPGYRTSVENQGTDHALTPDLRYRSTGGLGSVAASDPELLPVVEPPPMPRVPSIAWRSVALDGAVSGDQADDTRAIQAALDSGAPVIYLRGGRYNVSRTLNVPSTVQAIVGFDATIDATTGAFTGASEATIMRVADLGTTALTIGQVFFFSRPTVLDVENTSGRALHLEDVHASGVTFRGTASRLFVTNLDGGDGLHLSPGQEVWARQLDVERPFRKVINRGANLWVLGLKTEGPDTAITALDGARTQVVGGLLYPVLLTSPTEPAFRSENSELRVDAAESAYSSGRAHGVFLSSTRNGRTTTILSAALPRRGVAGCVGFGVEG